MNQLLKSTYKLMQQRTFIFHLGSKTYKFFSPKKINYRHAELQGNKAALQTDFWAEHVLEVSPYPLGLTMATGKPVSGQMPESAEQFINRKLHQAISYPHHVITEAFNLEKMRQLIAFGLEADLLSYAETILKNIRLPITSAHGDLHPGNMLCLGNKLMIIDWSMFSAKGSFITDYIHYYNYSTALQHKESWSKAILREATYLSDLSATLSLPVPQLRLLYCLSRISGEVSQRKSAGEVLPRQIKKYNVVLKQVLNELS
ncbi:phosphotransferase [Pontibacter qinzhouensis]|uniref:Phosphotransferase n=1 Tax=Pontibacter qinzhouensis TaxID=2603253 RepID=A0A5C8KAR8_9BACT|nr:phosphotransferase [Pontibacter qinzhouensis]TXK46766.1 phosphotransferase [Pontibacter qinzhouensis]